MWSIQYSGSRSSGGSRVKGLVGANNAVTPNTKYDFRADEVVLRNPVDGSEFAQGDTGSLTCNVLTAGPAANGRDQAGAFSASSWIHFYFIWGTGQSLATLASAVAPPTGPTLPTGYTHWAYATAIYFNGSSALADTLSKGGTVSYKLWDDANILAGGSATVETGITITAFVPPNALQFGVDTTHIAQISAGTLTAFEVFVVATKRYADFNVVGVATYANRGKGYFVAPNNSQTLRYIGYSPGSLYLYLQWYSVPNGDS